MERPSPKKRDKEKLSISTEKCGKLKNSPDAYGVTIKNMSNHDDIVMLKHFGLEV